MLFRSVALQLPVPLGRHAPKQAQPGLRMFPAWNWPHISVVYNAPLPKDDTAQWQIFWKIKHTCGLQLQGPMSPLVIADGMKTLRLNPKCQLFTQMSIVRQELLLNVGLQEQPSDFCPDPLAYNDFHITLFGQSAWSSTV